MTSQRRAGSPAADLGPSLFRGRSKIALVGFTEHRGLAPFQDDAWELWGLNDLYLDIPEVAHDRLRWFQLHAWTETVTTAAGQVRQPPCPRDPHHVDWLARYASEFPIYLMEPHAEVPAAEVLPRAAIEAYFGRRYFTNSVSWMLGMAIMALCPTPPREGGHAVDGAEIAVYGVDMMVAGGQGSEYGWQRPSCEWLLGIAEGAGIRVTLPPQSDLLATAFPYGDTAGNAFRDKIKAYRTELSRRRGMMTDQLEQARAGYTELTGGINVLDHLMLSWMPGDGPESSGRAPAPNAHKGVPAAPAVSDNFDG